MKRPAAAASMRRPAAKVKAKAAAKVKAKAKVKPPRGAASLAGEGARLAKASRHDKHGPVKLAQTNTVPSFMQARQDDA